MPIRIYVPFSYKDDVKKLGAVWVPDVKTRVIPDHINDINPFKAWLPSDRGTFVKYPFLIAKSERECWKCHKTTPLIALGAKNYTTLAFDPIWTTYDYPAFFVDIKSLDIAITSVLNERFSFFRKTYSTTLKKDVWVNTYEHCQTIQGDNYNMERHNIFGGYLNEKRTLFRGKHMEQIQLRFDYYIDAAIYDGIYHWNGFQEAE